MHFDGIAPINDVIVEQIGCQASGRKDMLDIDEPATGSQQPEDIFINGSLARIRLVMDRITRNDCIERGASLATTLRQVRPGGVG